MKINNGSEKVRKDYTQKIVPHLWFNNEAEEAANFYVSIFKNSKILNISYYGKAGAEVSGMQKGNVMTVYYEIEGQKFIALNGGPVFNFTPAISFFVNCDTQDEVDELWNKLSDGGEEVQCGWLKDKYDVSWQIVPTELEKILGRCNSEDSEKVMKELFKMKKIDVKKLKQVYLR
ncbi:VOC family protein [Clostridium felsineum]|uniref:VOC family protein n=1 Tax=Clostridium felsineum TaxID=36839 RepID=UPI00098CDBB3|nr:VOC family protein [Clostridium felsineum]URZ02851.1 hypothetical protein CLAUR_028850 [Clostridium felsineum]